MTSALTKKKGGGRKMANPTLVHCTGKEKYKNVNPPPQQRECFRSLLLAALPHLSSLALQALHALLSPLPSHPSGSTDRPHCVETEKEA